MSPMHPSRALALGVPTHRVIDGDRLLGASVLSLVLGIWVTLALQGLGLAEPDQRAPAASSHEQASLAAHPDLATHPEQR